MNTYYVRARSNRFTITYGHLVKADTADHARRKAQEYIDKNGLNCAVLKRARVATPSDIKSFRDLKKTVIE